MQNQSVLSRTISWLRFPLIVLVVLIHVSPGDGVEWESVPYAARLICSDFVRDGVARVAVPLFFFISGFLYFYKTDWGVPAYKRKTLSRVRTIVVPFCVWTALELAYRILVYKLGLTRSTFCVDHVTLWDWARDIFGLGNFSETSEVAFPLYIPFWFIRDLFVVGLLSPLWHFLLKRAGTPTLLVLGALWFAYRGFQIPGLSTTAVFFFCAGAYFPIRGRDFTEDFSKIGVPAAALYLPLLVVDALTKGADFNWIPHRAFICVSIVAVVFAVSRGVASGKLRESAFLSGATFFVYAGHTAVYLVSPMGKVLAWLSRFYVPASSAELIAVFFAKAAFQIGVCLLGYWILRRWARWALPFLTGGR